MSTGADGHREQLEHVIESVLYDLEALRNHPPAGMPLEQHESLTSGLQRVAEELSSRLAQLQAFAPAIRPEDAEEIIADLRANQSVLNDLVAEADALH